jgi:hypothetical protein
MLNKRSDKYECLNTDCKATFFKATVDKFNHQVAAENNLLNILSQKETRGWSGNQYFDPKKRKWRNGKKPKHINLGRRSWLWILLMFIIASVVITLVLNYFYPNSKFIIFGW